MKRNKLLEVIVLAARFFLAFIFIYAGIQKITDPAGFSQSIQNYKLFPIEVVNFFAITLPWMELICGLLLFFGINVRTNSLIISSLLIVFTLAIVISMIRGLNFDCGCFGKSSPIGWKKLGENFLLLLLSTILTIYDSRIFKLSDRTE